MGPLLLIVTSIRNNGLRLEDRETSTPAGAGSGIQDLYDSSSRIWKRAKIVNTLRLWTFLRIATCGEVWTYVLRIRDYFKLENFTIPCSHDVNLRISESLPSLFIAWFRVTISSIFRAKNRYKALVNEYAQFSHIPKLILSMIARNDNSFDGLIANVRRIRTKNFATIIE